MVTAAPPRPIRVLLVGDDDAGAAALLESLRRATTTRYELDAVDAYDRALADIERGGHDAYLVDLGIGPRSGLEMIRRAARVAPGAAVIIHTDSANRELEQAGVDAGAAGFLVKGETSPGLLDRTMRYAISRAHDLADARRECEEAEKKSRAKDDFLSVVSHELRSPLSSIIGWSSLLRIRKFDPHAVQEGLQSIEISAKAQAQLVEDLMDVSRIVNGKLRLRLRPLDLRHVAERAAQSAVPAADAKQLELETTLADEACPVRGDLDRLHQVVGNLLSNAIKFTPQGGRVVVAVSRDGAHVRASVSDTGIGISRELLPHVFDRLRQASSAPSGREGGIGLGLTIARELVVLHGGRLYVESAGRGTGATFTVELPVYEPAANSVPAA